MNKAKSLTKLIEETEKEVFGFPTPHDQIFPHRPEDIKHALEKRFGLLGVKDVMVDGVVVDDGGHIVVSLSDYEDNSMDVIFVHDDQEGSVALIGDEDEGDDSEQIMIDLGGLAPTLVDTPTGRFINLLELSWLSKPTLMTILTAGGLMTKSVSKDYYYQKDAFGNRIIVPVPTESFATGQRVEAIVEELKEGEKVVEAIYKTVIRGGKKVRLPVVRRRIKRRLSPKQRLAIRKAARTRRAHKAQIARKRKRSLMARKRLHIKPQPVRKGFRVRG